MGRNSLIPGPNQHDNDLVMTPSDLALKIINHFPLAGVVLDPAKGGGSFYSQFPSTVDKDWCEIEAGKDFYTYTKTVNWIVTNPPWSHMRKWLTHSMEIAQDIVLLSTLTHFVTKARLRDIKDRGFGLKEFLCVPTPKSPWPANGFQLGAMHLQKAYEGPLTISGEVGK